MLRGAALNMSRREGTALRCVTFTSHRVPLVWLAQSGSPARRKSVSNVFDRGVVADDDRSSAPSDDITRRVRTNSTDQTRTLHSRHFCDIRSLCSIDVPYCRCNSKSKGERELPIACRSKFNEGVDGDESSIPTYRKWVDVNRINTQSFVGRCCGHGTQCWFHRL